MQLIFGEIKDKKLLRKAIRKTFGNRKTQIPESFFATAYEFESAILQKAWGSVALSTGEEPFDDVWENFLTVLRSLES
jgi:hypothetical protein